MKNLRAHISAGLLLAAANNAALAQAQPIPQAPADSAIPVNVEKLTPDGSYGIPEGLIFGYPCTTSGGKYQVVKGLSHNDFAKAKIAATQKELTEERAAIEQLLK